MPHLHEVLGITPDSTLEEFEQMKCNLATMLETNDEDGLARVGAALYKDATTMPEPSPTVKAVAKGAAFDGGMDTSE